MPLPDLRDVVTPIKPSPKVVLFWLFVMVVAFGLYFYSQAQIAQ